MHLSNRFDVDGSKTGEREFQAFHFCETRLRHSFDELFEVLDAEWRGVPEENRLLSKGDKFRIVRVLAEETNTELGDRDFESGEFQSLDSTFPQIS